MILLKFFKSFCVDGKIDPFQIGGAVLFREHKIDVSVSLIKRHITREYRSDMSFSIHCIISKYLGQFERHGAVSPIAVLPLTSCLLLLKQNRTVCLNIIGLNQHNGRLHQCAV